MNYLRFIIKYQIIRNLEFYNYMTMKASAAVQRQKTSFVPAKL